MTRMCLLALLLPLFAVGLRGDALELKTGERIEGTFKQATSAGAVIEVGGQSITFPLGKLRAIYFGVFARSVGGAAPSKESLGDLYVPPLRPAAQIADPQTKAESVPISADPKPFEGPPSFSSQNPDVVAFKPPSSAPNGGTANAAHRAGGNVIAPSVIYKIDPGYTKEARHAKLSGTVVLYLEVDETGHARNIRVVKGIGLGLDEKAIEAVKKWRFKPGQQDGKPVTVEAHIEVNFHTLEEPSKVTK